MKRNVLPEALVMEVIQNTELIAKENGIPFEDALEQITREACQQRGRKRHDRNIQMVFDEVLRRRQQRGARGHEQKHP